MGKIKKSALMLGSMLSVATVAVAVNNAIDINYEEPGHEQGCYEKYVKRPLDFFCAGLALIVFSPILIGTAALVKCKLGSPVLFVQERPGKNEKVFKLMKFRTMTNGHDENGKLLPDADRLTRFGAFLRSTSIDELPELINIMKGDLAIVGPRPLLVQYLCRYNEEQHHRHDVRPGLTGYAQSHGRNAVSWEDKFAMDIWYTKNITFKNDVKILLDTIKTVLLHEGISSDNAATMEEFMGTPKGIKATWKAPK